MKITVINGSPRNKGNSDLLCDAFIKGALENNNEIVKISLRDYQISPCKACYACFTTQKCFQPDNMGEIIDQVKEADVLVLATPTYFLTMSGQMKVFIDRLLPQWQNLDGKTVYVIVTGHDGKEGLIRTGNDLVDIFTHLGNTVKPVIYGDHVWQKGEVLKTKAMQQAYEAGLEIK